MGEEDMRVAVSYPIFASNKVLRKELEARFGNVRINETGRILNGDELIEFLSGATHVITGLEKMTSAVFSKLPDLKVIGKLGVGLDMIDLKEASRRGVRIGWKGGVNRRSVSELALGFMLMLLRRVPEANFDLRNQLWKQRIGNNLTGRKIGIVGCGHVGKDLIQLLQPFGCEIRAHDIKRDEEFGIRFQVQWTGLDELLQTSDVVSLHIPLQESTRNLMNAARLTSMKRGAILINTARGGIVDEIKLLDLLSNGSIAGAGFDVFAVEPTDYQALVKAPNFICTSHMGACTEESMLAMGRSAMDGLLNHADAISLIEYA